MLGRKEVKLRGQGYVWEIILDKSRVQKARREKGAVTGRA